MGTTPNARLKPLPPTQGNPYYPSKFKTGELDNEWRMVFDHMHQQTRINEDLQGQLSALQKKHSKMADRIDNGPSNTKIGGFNVAAQTPNDADRLTYDAKSSQIVWKP